jgi:HAD superfamily hydrolase (TIGR01549 family)
LKRLLAILFDLDGTLIEYNIRGEEAKKEFIQYIESLGFGESIDNTMPLGLIIKQLSKGSQEKAKRLLEIANEIYKKYELEAADNSRPKEYATEALTALREKKIKTAITTNNSKDAVMRSLSRTNLLRFIDVIVTRDDVTEIKPSPEMLIKAARLLNAPLNMCLHVGDSYVDVLAARSTGMMAVAVAGSVMTVDTLNKYHPHFVIIDLRELVRLLDD